MVWDWPGGYGVWGALRRAVWVVVSGLAVAAGVNALSPRGLDLGRDYFSSVEPPANGGHAAVAEGDAEWVVRQAIARLERQGLGWVDAVGMGKLYGDVRREMGLVLFIDARNEALYREGHVPGARLFDQYHPEAELATVLPLCQAAEQIVVYCHGADCEDSELAAMFLASAGVPKERLVVYLGGYEEWVAKGRPVETESGGGTGKEVPTTP